jgi:hypothetical protein
MGELVEDRGFLPNTPSRNIPSLMRNNELAFHTTKEGKKLKQNLLKFLAFYWPSFFVLFVSWV